jgi:protein-S-isoprenylcysteine O-methyltransferase Ste14
VQTVPTIDHLTETLPDDPGRARNRRTRRAFWATASVYLLIAFEFFYMASPFAVYFYAAYGPSLSFLNETWAFSWLSRAFLPHIAAQTRSPLIDAHNIVGAVLAIGGFAGFCVGAIQVYYRKLTRRGMATRGIYTRVRHPQYAFLILSSIGMLLLWPRYVVLVSFVTMLFAYYFLARVEEHECSAKFGSTYEEYLRTTPMFLPFRLPRTLRLPKLPTLPASRSARAAVVLVTYLAAVATAVGTAREVNELTLDSLYARYQPNTAYVSVTRLSDGDLARIAALVAGDSRAAAVTTGANPGATYLDYVLPADWYVSETLMAKMSGFEPMLGAGYDGTSYRVVITRAKLRNPAQGRDILHSVTERTAVLEVVVDLSRDAVTDVLPPDSSPRYRGIPVPVY